MTPPRHAIFKFGRAAAACMLMATLSVPVASAQGGRNGPGAGPSAPTGGPLNLSQSNRNEPIRIEAGNLEVRDKEKIATFTENVRVTQGESTLECKKLIVYYVGDAASGSTAPQPASVTPGGSNQQIRKLEAKGGVVLTQKDQTAIGDEAVYDAATNRITLVGNVVLTQGQNVVRGDRLWVNMNTGVYEVKSNGSGRVQSVIAPNSMKDNAHPGATPPTPAPRNGANGPTGSVSSQGTNRSQSSTATDKDRSGKQQSAPRPLKLN